MVGLEIKPKSFGNLVFFQAQWSSLAADDLNQFYSPEDCSPPPQPQRGKGEMLPPPLNQIFRIFLQTCFRIFSGRFDTSGSMIALLVPKIEGGSPERDGGGGEEEEEEEGQVWGNSMSLDYFIVI